MMCGRRFIGLALAAAFLPLYGWLVAWMRTLVDERDASSVIGFVGWSAFFFYLGMRIILRTLALSVDKTAGVK